MNKLCETRVLEKFPLNDNEFLVYDRYDIEQFRITRYKQEEQELKKIFEVKFNNFYYITKDRLLFTHGDNFCLGIYSIKDNNYIEAGKWLNGKRVEPFFHEDKKEKIGLYVEEQILSYKLGHYKILFTVDPHTLQPNSNCYSEYSNKYIKVSSKKDIKKIKEEDTENIRRIEANLEPERNKRLQKVKEKLIKNEKN